MRKLIQKISKKAALPPGTLVHIGTKRTDKPKLSLMDYNVDGFDEKILDTIEESFDYKDRNSVSWVNIDGVHDTVLIEKVGKYFAWHPLVLEDIVNTAQRPKMEAYDDDYVFFVLKMLRYDDKDHHTHCEQMSVILGPRYVVSFQEAEGDVFDPIRERIKKGKGRIRKLGADYLAYALIDAIVDHYYSILEKVGEHIEDIEKKLLKDPNIKTLQMIHMMKSEILYLRKAVWPLRELVNTFQREEIPLIKESTQLYLRDVYDHTIQVIDTIESYRDVISGLSDLYLSSVSNRMNEVMKTLTLIATIFIPLTFLAGIYGMNFKHMPELEWRWSYPTFWCVIVMTGFLMYVFFKKKRWF